MAIHCSICGKLVPPYSEDHPEFGGHNAWPINDGRCCSDCNENVVLWERLADLTRPTPKHDWSKRRLPAGTVERTATGHAIRLRAPPGRKH
jgi:hypothetical protein